MRNSPVVVALLCAAALAGCDPIYGVTRYATVAAMPAPAQVLAAVRGVPGIDSVRVLDGPTGPDQRADSVITVAYAGGADVRGLVEFARGPGGVRYRQFVGYMGGPPSQRELDASYPAMLAVEERLASLPGLAGLRRAVAQECSRLRCPSPPGRPTVEGG